MRRTGSAVVALLGVLLLASCAVTPPVLGGRPTSSAAPGEFSDEDVVALLIVDDPDAENTVLDLAAYRAESGDVGCPGVPLLLPDDVSEGGSIVVSPPLFRDAPGADLLVAQVARRFASAAEANAFLVALRDTRAECPGVEIVEGDVAVDAVGFESTGPDATSFEWVLVHANVAVSLSADLVDVDAGDVLRALAEEYADTLTAG